MSQTGSGSHGSSHSSIPIQWSSAVEGILQDLTSKSLLRVQRPTVPLLSSSEASISAADLQAWVSGQPTHSASTSTAEPLTHCSTAPLVRQWSPDQPAAVSPSSKLLHCIPNQVDGLLPGQSSFSHFYGPSPASSIVQPVESPAEPRQLKLFSLNDYLGLASHPDVCGAAASAAKQYGMGSRSSAIVGGTTVIHRELEEALAKLKGTEDCLLCPTGYAANMAVVTSLASLAGSVAILSDELNHASIIDGARLAVRSSSHVKLHVYRHNDMAHLEQLLNGLPCGTRAMVVTDSLFSMDGDFADLKALGRLKDKYGFLLVVDEAHATLVVGEHGGGAAEAMSVAHKVDVHVGTLSKAFGALGGFIATTRSIKQLLVNKGRPYIYSTALPIPVVAAAQAALAVSYRESWRRAHVWNLVRRLGGALEVPALSPVVPLVVGAEQDAVDLGSLMLQQGMHVPAIRPPTVPAGTCRLRVSLSAAHSTADVDVLVSAVREAGAQLHVLPHLELQQLEQEQEGWCMPYSWPAAAPAAPTKATPSNPHSVSCHVQQQVLTQ